MNNENLKEDWPTFKQGSRILWGSRNGVEQAGIYDFGLSGNAHIEIQGTRFVVPEDTIRRNNRPRTPTKYVSTGDFNRNSLNAPETNAVQEIERLSRFAEGQRQRKLKRLFGK